MMRQPLKRIMARFAPTQQAKIALLIDAYTSMSPYKSFLGAFAKQTERDFKRQLLILDQVLKVIVFYLTFKSSP